MISGLSRSMMKRSRCPRFRGCILLFLLMGAPATAGAGEPDQDGVACWPLLHGACDPENSDLAAWRRKTLLGVVRMHLAYWTGAQPASAPVSCTPGRLPAAFIGPGNLHSRAAGGTPCSSRRSASLLRPQGALGSGPTGAAMASPSQVQCCTLADRGPGAQNPV